MLIESIDNDNPILIHSADCILDRSTEINIEEFDIVVYTKNNYRRAYSQQLNYGWVNSINGSIKNLSIKSTPETKESNVIIGSFLFKNKDLFKNLYEDTKKNISHSLEMHIDHMVETAIKNGMKVKEEYSEKSSMLGTLLSMSCSIIWTKLMITWNRMIKLTLVVPCFNEEKSIPKLIKSISKLNSNIDFLIVENGSTMIQKFI